MAREAELEERSQNIGTATLGKQRRSGGSWVGLRGLGASPRPSGGTGGTGKPG